MGADLVARGIEFVVAGVTHVIHAEREVVLSASACPSSDWRAARVLIGLFWTGTPQTLQLLELSGESEAIEPRYSVPGPSLSQCWHARASVFGTGIGDKSLLAKFGIETALGLRVQAPAAPPSLHCTRSPSPLKHQTYLPIALSLALSSFFFAFSFLCLLFFAVL